MSPTLERTNLPRETADALYALERLLHKHHAVTEEEAKAALTIILKDVEDPVVFDVNLPGIEQPPDPEPEPEAPAEETPAVDAETPAATETGEEKPSETEASEATPSPEAAATQEEPAEKAEDVSSDATSPTAEAADPAPVDESEKPSEG